MPSTPPPSAPQQPPTTPATPPPRTRRALAAALALTAGACVAGPTTAGVTTGVTASALVVTTATAGAPTAVAVPADRIELVDTAGVIDPAALERGLAGVEFREPTRVVVYTERGADLSALSDDAASQKFNGRVLTHARERHPEWISDDGQKWADGLMIFALDPANRMMGVYYGEDRRISTDQQAEVREDAADAARDARWTDAAVDAVDASAELIGRPWQEDPAMWAGMGGGLLGLGGVGAALWAVFVHPPRARRKRALADLEAARTHLTAVTLEMDATEVNASTVPDEDPHGARLLERFRGFRRRSLEATAELERLDAVPERGQRSKEFEEDAAALRAEVAELDGLDDAVGAADTLLNRRPGWQDAWDLQTAPLLEDLRGIDELRTALPSDDPAVATGLDALEGFRSEAEGRLEGLAAGIAAGRLAPSAALDGLAALRRELTGRLDRLAEAVVAGAGRNREERRMMRRDIDAGRSRRRSARGSLLDTESGATVYWSVGSFRSGYSSGHSAIESSRTSSSSGTGYGSSGGSFSGSGSSGRF